MVLAGAVSPWCWRVWKAVSGFHSSSRHLGNPRVHAPCPLCAASYRVLLLRADRAYSTRTEKFLWKLWKKIIEESANLKFTLALAGNSLQIKKKKKRKQRKSGWKRSGISVLRSIEYHPSPKKHLFATNRQLQRPQLLKMQRITDHGMQSPNWYKYNTTPTPKAWCYRYFFYHCDKAS